MLLDLAPASRIQGDLWSAPDTLRSKSLMKALDSLNAYYRLGTLTYVSTAGGKLGEEGLRFIVLHKKLASYAHDRSAAKTRVAIRC
jgi:hypothetical protein